ncbi:3'-5' exonuclease [Microbacterium sp. GXS0129]|uniref:3'-5' exonuclease n=1 Tax=Microbacterium sp. GXS0129 TaxID=3377836 RepID=UPI00383B3B9E
MPVDFTAIDFETANSSTASACAVGLARVRDGVVVATDGWLMRPPPGHEEFHPRNVEIHGITPADVASAPGWSDQLGRLRDFLGDDVLVAHNAGFDMSVMRRACAATGDELAPYRYMCSVQLSRSTYVLPSHSLPYAAAAAGFLEFQHHDASADALACAHIVIDAARRARATDLDALSMATGVRISRIPDEAAVSVLV